MASTVPQALPCGMKLTYDILLHIISSSSFAKDAVELMATCQVLYREGPKIALKAPVVISTSGSLASFLLFLHADNSSRCRYLRHLELKSFSLEANILQELIRTLPLLTNIRCLRLDEAEIILDLHPALTPAFRALTTLRHIDFSGVKNRSCALLSRLHSPLISAKINFLTDEGNELWDYLDDDEWDGCHPTILLDNFASTLEELQCVCWHTTPDEAVMPFEVFPKMRKLSIELHHFPLRMDPFIRAFPNLTDLHLDTEYHNSRGGMANLQESHTTNVAQQLDPVNSCGTWEHLEHVRGSLVDLYAVGLTSPVRRLTLTDMMDGATKTLEMLATVLRYARPLRLKVEAFSGTFLGDNTRGFISMLRDASASNLMNLDITIDFDEGDREKDLSAVIDNLVSALVGLPLQFLELGFVTGDLDPTPSGPTVLDRMISQQKGLQLEPPAPIVSAPLTPAELSLQGLDMDALVARLESIPSLQAAHILLRGSRHGSDCDWEGHERTITKGTSRLAGREQWGSWLPGKNELALTQS